MRQLWRIGYDLQTVTEPMPNRALFALSRPDMNQWHGGKSMNWERISRKLTSSLAQAQSCRLQAGVRMISKAAG